MSGAGVAVLRNPERLAAVRRLVPLYRTPSVTFDRLTRLAAELLEAPIAILTLIDADRQFFVSSHGLSEPFRSARETPLEYSFCQYAVASGRPLIVGNAVSDPRLQDHRAVVELGVVAYAGIPLTTAEGHTIGTFCVLDLVARDWTDDKLAVLADLAAIAIDEIRLAGLARHAAFEREWRSVPGR